ALVKLSSAVSCECRHELGRERYCAPALVGFQCGELEPAAGSLQAGTGMPGTAGWAVVAVAVLSAAVRVSAAMPPGKPLKLPANRQCRGVEIDVLPAESSASPWRNPWAKAT